MPASSTTTLPADSPLTSRAGSSRADSSPRAGRFVRAHRARTRAPKGRAPKGGIRGRATGSRIAVAVASLAMSLGIALTGPGLAWAASPKPTAHPTPPFVADLSVVPSIVLGEDGGEDSLRSDLTGTLTSNSKSALKIWTYDGWTMKWTQAFEGSISASDGASVPATASWLTACHALNVGPRYLVTIEPANTKGVIWGQFVSEEDEIFWAQLTKADVRNLTSNEVAPIKGLNESPHQTSCDRLPQPTPSPTPEPTAQPITFTRSLPRLFETDLALTARPSASGPGSIDYTLAGTASLKNGANHLSVRVSTRDSQGWNVNLDFSPADDWWAAHWADEPNPGLPSTLDINKSFTLDCSLLGSGSVYAAEVFVATPTQVDSAGVATDGVSYLVAFGPAAGVEGPDSYARLPEDGLNYIDVSTLPALPPCDPSATPDPSATDDPSPTDDPAMTDDPGSIGQPTQPTPFPTPGVTAIPTPAPVTPGSTNGNDGSAPILGVFGLLFFSLVLVGLRLTPSLEDLDGLRDRLIVLGYDEDLDDEDDGEDDLDDQDDSADGATDDTTDPDTANTGDDR